MEATMQNETAMELKEMLGLEEGYGSNSLELLASSGSKYLKDLKMNIKTILRSENLSEKEVALLGVALAANEKNDALSGYFKGMAQDQGASMEEVGDAVACASLLSSNNVFYRFRHFTGKDEYQNMPARLRMSIMMNPILGKEFFELVSLAVSAVNGCQMCVNAHENSLVEMGTTHERIFDAVRMASVVTSLSKVIH